MTTWNSLIQLIKVNSMNFTKKILRRLCSFILRSPLHTVAKVKNAKMEFYLIF